MLWAVLVFDSLLVGYLGLVLATAQVLIARRATERSGVALVEESQDAGERAAVDEQALAGNVAGLS